MVFFLAEEEGKKVGHLRLRVVWPLPKKKIIELAGRAKSIVFPEMNLGQVSKEVSGLITDGTPVIPVTHCGGTVHRPEQIFEKILEGAK